MKTLQVCNAFQSYVSVLVGAFQEHGNSFEDRGLNTGNRSGIDLRKECARSVMLPNIMKKKRQFKEFVEHRLLLRKISSHSVINYLFLIRGKNISNKPKGNQKILDLTKDILFVQITIEIMLKLYIKKVAKVLMDLSR